MHSGGGGKKMETRISMILYMEPTVQKKTAVKH